MALSSLAYAMITQTPLVACNFPIKTLVARQRPTRAHIAHSLTNNYYVCVCAEHITQALRGEGKRRTWYQLHAHIMLITISRHSIFGTSLSLGKSHILSI